MARSNWVPVGVKAAADQYLYTAAIDPADRRHVVTGAMSDGVSVTFDGGQTWQRSTRLSATGRVNAFSIAVSPADPGTVWAEGFDTAQTGNGARHIWRSTDGGRSFRPVIDGTRVTLMKGTPRWPSPVNPDLLYFEFGTSFAGGTDLDRLDDRLQKVTSQHNNHDGISSLAFHLTDPRLLYLGLAGER
jgi:hypothetical protein